MIRGLLLLLFVCLFPRAALAHRSSDALLRVVAEPTSLQARWEVALRDLDVQPGGIDDGDRLVHRSELLVQEPALFAQLRAHVRFSAGGVPCTIEPQAPTLTVTEHSDGTYAALSASVLCPTRGALTLDYDYLFETDPQHRLILQVGSETHVLGSDHRSVLIDLQAPARTPNLFSSGLTHILEGTDHLLFLLALLLPAVLTKRAQTLEPAPSFRPVAREVLAVVTAFTVAHSLTLSLAVLGLALLPARFIEPAIAASVAVAALANVRAPRSGARFDGARWPIAYTLGLLHGYGFSSALDDVGLQGASLTAPLLTFNLGVEVGQLAVVAVLLPVLFWLRRWRGYRSVILIGGSVVVALIACFWFVERAFHVRLLG